MEVGTTGALTERAIRIGPLRISVAARTDTPGRELDRELRLLFRALEPPGPGRWLEAPSWDAALPMAIEAAGWEGEGTLTPLDLGAASSCAVGLRGLGGWRLASWGEPPAALADFGVVRIPYWFGRAGVEWCLAHVARSLAPGGLLFVLGDRARGAASVHRAALRIVGPAVRQAVGEHRRLYVHERSDRPPSEAWSVWRSEAVVAGRALTVHHHPLVFSPGKVDAATARLAENLPARGGRWLDLGSGSGLIAAAAAQGGDRDVTAIDWSYAAVEATARTLAANGLSANVIVADGVPAEAGRFDVIACYPPFHVGPRVSHDGAAALLAGARRALAPGGEARVVLTSAQSPARLLTPVFERVELVEAGGATRVYACRGQRSGGGGKRR